MQKVVVVGGGIVGLATARAVLRARPSCQVVVLEKADETGTGQTGHNSGVVHAGIYYPPGTLKASLCRAGAQATAEYCQERGLPFQRTGKLIIATSAAEARRLGALSDRAARNGIPLEYVDRARLASLEPNVSGQAALLSPSTAITDFRAIARAMSAEIVASGGQVITRARVWRITEAGGATGQVRVGSDRGDFIADALVACAGAQADRVARMGGLDPDFRIVPFRGEYFQLPHSAAGPPITRMIYPVPLPELPFLGVHFTPTVDGRVTVGPNAVLGLSREHSARAAVNARDVASYLSFAGMWKFLPGYVRTGAAEVANVLSSRRYLRQVNRYLPAITRADLLPYPAGVRAQAVLTDGSPAEAFLIHRTDRQLHVCNAPSPAATSAIPIGQRLAKLLLDRME